MRHTKMYKEIFQTPQILKDGLEKNIPEIKKIANEIKKYTPQSIIMAGRGTSCNASKFAKYLFEIYCGIPVSIAAPSVLTKYNGKLNLENTLVIGVSQSGAAEDVCSLIDRGNENGAMTIAITNTENSLLANAAKIHIDCYAGLEESLAATKSFTAQLAILTALVAYVSDNKYLIESIDKIVDAVEAGMVLADEVEQTISRYRFTNECLILARGYEYPIALEMEIKIQETASIRSQAYSIVNFIHGPIAMLDKSIPVIVLAIDDKTNDDVAPMLERIKAANVETLMITNRPELVERSSGQALMLPEWCEGVLGAFATVPVMQLISCEIAVDRDKNPDSPEGLTKVTVTR